MAWVRRFFKYYLSLMLMVIVLMFILSLPKAILTSPKASAVILDNQGAFIAQVGGGDPFGYGYWPIKEVPPRIMQATLALEDKRFWNHWGIDPMALCRALWQNVSSGRRISGASTLTMQIARMQNPGARSYFKKLQEMFVAILITLRYDRQDILKHYLRLVPYANQSHGIAHAAHIYFAKPVEDLSWAEITFLSAIPQAPGLSNPFTYKGSKRARQRGAFLLNALYEAKLMDEAEYELSRQQLAALDLSHRQTRNAQFMHAILYLQEQYKKQELPHILRTHLNSRLQGKVNDLSYSMLQRLRPHGAENIAVVVTRRNDNAVLAWSGSTDYFDEEGAGALDYIRTPRSPGSTLKPFIYALAFERDVIRANSLLDDLPGNARGVRNADGRYLGPMLPRNALANSRNIPAIKLVEDIGMNEVYLHLQNLGLHRNQHNGGFFGLGLAVGAMPTTLEQIMTAYSSLANDGRLIPLNWFKDKASQGRQIYSQDIARLLSLHLSDPMARLPSFPRMGSSEYPFAVALKTGTSQGYRDAWTIAYSQDYLVGVWIGRPDAKGMKQLSGSRSASYLVKQILMHLHQDEERGQKDLGFPNPRGRQLVNICSYSGYLANRDCHQQQAEWLLAKHRPTRNTPVSWVKIDKRNALLAGDWTPKQHWVYKKYLDLPGRYRDWARNRGLAVPPLKISLLDYRKGMNLPIQRIALQSTKLAVKIAAPVNGSRILINPNVSQEHNSIRLHAEVEGRVQEVLWYVDDMPYKLAAAPYSIRWPLKAGRHRFHVELPYLKKRSKAVTILVE